MTTTASPQHVLSPLPPAADRNEQQKLIALFDALDDLEQTPGISLWSARHTSALETALLWASARNYRVRATEIAIYVTRPDFVVIVTVYLGKP